MCISQQYCLDEGIGRARALQSADNGIGLSTAAIRIGTSRDGDSNQHFALRPFESVLSATAIQIGNSLNGGGDIFEIPSALARGGGDLFEVLSKHVIEISAAGVIVTN